MAYALGQLHWGMLVFDVRQGRFSGIEIDPTNLPIETSPEDRLMIFRSIVESWAILGMSLWAACGATFESPMSVIYQNQDDIMEFCIDEVVRAIKSDRAPLAGQ
jgi:hypothetical protein